MFGLSTIHHLNADYHERYQSQKRELDLSTRDFIVRENILNHLYSKGPKKLDQLQSFGHSWIEVLSELPRSQSDHIVARQLLDLELRGRVVKREVYGVDYYDRSGQL